MFRALLVLGAVFMIFLIIVYWDDVGAANLNFLPPVSPGPRHRPPSPAKQKPQPSRSPSFLSDIDAFVNQFLEPGTGEPTEPSPVDPGNQSEKAEERYIPRQEWKVHQTPLAPELLERQVAFRNFDSDYLDVLFRSQSIRSEAKIHPNAKALIPILFHTHFFFLHPVFL